ncbi:MAG TPA: adenylyltransferase [Nannocystis exedens]|nr:adenylyltransferase [Nannocystis exedens]
MSRPSATHAPRDHFLVLGAGGLGAPALLGLLAAGARRLTIVDRDRVETSNLQRQVLFDVGDVGAAKASAAKAQLCRRANDLIIDAHVVNLNRQSLAELLDRHQRDALVLECTDSPRLKFMINDACLARGIPAVIGGAVRWRGQALALRRGAGACYRCIFESPPPPELAAPCSAVGVIGTAVGVFGHLMALHAWRLANGEQDSAGTLLAMDLFTLQIQRLRPRPRKNCPACSDTCSDPTPTPLPEPPRGPRSLSPDH